MRGVLVVLTGLLQAGCMIPYIAGIFRGTSKPTKSTWFIWAALDCITLTSLCMKGESNVQIWVAAISASFTALLTLKYGQPGWSRLDTACLAGAVLAVALWAMSGDALFALLTSLSATLIGTMPTAASAWQDPSCENKLAWTIGTAASVCCVLTVKEWTVTVAAQPVAFLLLNGCMTAILYLRPRFIRTVATP